MKKLLKIGGIVFTKDPEGNYRLLLRHNRPFNGHLDHWTIVSGTIDEGENALQATTREIKEEFSITEFDRVVDLNYQYDLEVGNEVWNITYYAFQVKEIDIRVILDWESIGYNWCTFKEAKELIREHFVQNAIVLLGKELHIIPISLQ